MSRRCYAGPLPQPVLRNSKVQRAGAFVSPPAPARSDTRGKGWERGTGARGFTLVEVLVAIIILLFGVIVALRIFPRGFAAFTESQQTTTAYKVANNLSEEFKQNPETIPDGIYPLDTDWNSSSAIAKVMDFDDMQAVEYRAALGDDNFRWYNEHLYPTITRNPDGTVPRLPDGSVVVTPRWPLWQPPGARVFRRVMGEKVILPAGRSADVVDDVLASVTNVVYDGATNTTAVSVTIADPTKPILHGMWLAVDTVPADSTKINLLLQIPFDGTDPLKKIGQTDTDNPITLPGKPPIIAGAVLRQFAPAAFVPKYLPHFGPIIPNGTLQYNAALKKFVYKWDDVVIDPTVSPAVVEQSPVTLYDIRYRRVSRDEFESKADNAGKLPDTFYYTLARGTSVHDAALNDKIKLLPDGTRRYVRFTFTLQAGTTVKYQAPKNFLLPATGDAAPKTLYNLNYTDAGGTTTNLYIIAKINPLDQTCEIKIADKKSEPAIIANPDPSYLIQITGSDFPLFVSGSEQINRAYRYFADPANVEAIQPDEDPTSQTYNPAKLNIYNTKLAAMPSGYYYFPRMDADSISGVALPGTIYFSAADRGRTVKLDYTVADWGTLHEDLTPNDEGYVTLALADPKIADKPTGPREEHTWGLYGPMQHDGHDAMIGLVDTRTDMVYHLVAREGDAQHPFGVEPASGVAVPGQVIAVDLSQSAAGRLRLGSVPDGVTWRGSWQNVATIAYKKNDGVQYDGLPYQCIKDYNPSGAANDPTAPGIGAQWQTYWERIENPNWLKLSGVAFRVFYRARRDWTLQVFKAPAVFWLKAERPSRSDLPTLQADLADQELDWRSACWARQTDAVDPTKQVAGWVGVPGIYQGQSVAVDYFYQTTDGDGSAELTRVSGEVHSVPTREASKANSLFRLAHPPAPNTLITVRGVSVTVRALWVQQRAGQAAVMDTDPTKPGSRQLNERWTGKSITFTLPVSK